MLVLCILKRSKESSLLQFSFIKSTIFFSYYVLCTLRFCLQHQYFQPEHGFKLLEAVLKNLKQSRLIERQSLLWELLIQYNGCSVVFCYSENLYTLTSRSDLLFICLFRIVCNSDDTDSSIPLYIKKCVVTNLLSQTDTFKITLLSNSLCIILFVFRVTMFMR